MTKKKNPEELLKRGAPVQIGAARKISVYLDEDTIAKALKLGNGNISEGIRIKFGNKSD